MDPLFEISVQDCTADRWSVIWKHVTGYELQDKPLKSLTAMETPAVNKQTGVRQTYAKQGARYAGLIEKGLCHPSPMEFFHWLKDLVDNRQWT